MRRIEISLPTGYNQMCNRFPSTSGFQKQASRMSDNGRKEVTEPVLDRNEDSHSPKNNEDMRLARGVGVDMR